MKTAINILIFTLFINSSALSQWSKVPGPYGGVFTDIERVGNEIWLSSISGLYISQNEGLTWNKSNLVNSFCFDVAYYNDTIVVIYSERINSALDYETKSISSYDNGLTWQLPVYLMDGEGHGAKLIKSSNVLFFTFDTVRKQSTNGGATWVTPSPLFQRIYTEGNGVLGISGTGSNKVNFSPNGLPPWTEIYSGYFVTTFKIFGNCIYIADFDTTLQSMKLIRSCDFGTTWTDLLLSASQIGNGELINLFDTLYVRSSGNVFASSDSGNTWFNSSWPILQLTSEGVYTNSGNRVIKHANNQNVFTYIPSQNILLPTQTGTTAHFIKSLYANKGKLFASTLTDFWMSSDGGNSWQKKYTEPLIKMTFYNDTIYAINQEQNSYLYKSYDNGLTWDTLLIPIANFSLHERVSIVRINSDIYISQSDTILKSNDEGISWQYVPPIPGISINGCSPNNDATGGVIGSFNSELFALTNVGYIFKYNDLAQTWLPMFAFCNGVARDYDYIKQIGTKLVAKYYNMIYISADSGLTWYPSDYCKSEIIEFGNVWYSTLGYAEVVYSTDEGSSWLQLDTDSSFNAQNFLCLLNGNFYSDAYFDGIYRRTNSLFSLQGNVFFDTNNDGFKNNGEVGINQILMTVNPATYTATTNALGDYLLVTDMSGSISPSSPTPFASITPPIFNYTGQTDSVDFAIHLPANIFDLKADVTNTNVFNPGFETSLQLTISNYGNTISNASTKLIIDTSVDFISAIPSPTFVSGDTLFWNLSTLNFLDQTTIQVIVETTPGTPIGSVVTFSLEAIPVIGDTLPLDNFSAFEAVVVGSFDPNDKTCLQGEIFTPAQLQNNTPLEYIIRFQNTGNFPTSFVIIQDTLSNLLDLSTFKFISSSHACRWSIDGQGILIITFNPLALPPESSDPLNSHGFFKYAIKCKNGIDIGNAINNKASIIFDFNPAIVTNTVTTLISNPIPLQIPEMSPTIVSLLPFPNPSKEFITIKNLEFNGSNEIYALIVNSQGLYIQTIPISKSEPMLDISQLKSGLYFSKLVSKEGKVLGKIRFIKVN
ncbi:MAG: hypothetical protein JNL49_10540 [Bacteroidia bacterium]|nr:hypothetical protein [Bacteroidia bacterium]